MNKKLLSILGIILSFHAHLLNAQSLVNVSPLTGTANVTVPVYTISNGQASVPISLSYLATGVKPQDVEGSAGMGWQLNAGGQISRQVRGLPDDCTKDNAGNTMLGWMSTSNTGASYAGSFTKLNNGSTCSNGTSDITNINNNIPYTDDTEPDLFSVSAPGLSCEMVYDRANARFHPVNYRDLVITYTVTGGTGYNAGDITSFTITNDKGIKYVFAAPESTTQTTTLPGSVAPNYFATRYAQYKNGISYSDAWNLTSITDAEGNGLILTYASGSYRQSTDPVELFLGGSSTQTLLYNVQQTVITQLLNNISITNNNNAAGNTLAHFDWDSTGTNQPYVISLSVMGLNYYFYYNNVAYNGGYTRAFLTNFKEGDCGSLTNYQFGYAGVNTGNGTTTLPDSTSKQLDYWGYYSSSASTTTLLPSVYVNPSTVGYPRYVVATGASPGSVYSYSLPATSTRATTAATVAYGSLNTISYAQGGTTTITYQPNDYYDVPSASTIQGGGIRVQQIVDAPGNGATNTITRNYSYVNSSGQSTGEPTTLPQFAFTIPYTGGANNQALWTAATALSAYDLSTDDHTILYSSVKESQTGAGSTVYNYNNPATYWNTSAGPVCSGCSTTEWYPTVNDAASYNCAINNGPIANLTYSYPFTPNPNYDFERGLPSSTIAYNDNGTEASEIDYTYQRSYSPTVITAFKSDDGPAGSVAKFYNQYTVFYNTSELTATVTRKIFDTNNQGQAQSSTVAYAYNSAYHKLLTQQTVTNSDNSTINTFYKYVKDYAPNSGASNANINALYNLQQLNINSPVETWQQVTRGGTTLTTGATLTLYSPSVNGAVTNYPPSRQSKVIQPNGAATFTPFSINTAAQTISPDPNYFTAINYDKYDNTGHPETIDDNNKHVLTTNFDPFSNQTTAVFKNANYNEVAFDDFDSQFAPGINTFTISGISSYTPVGSHAGNAAGLAATTQTVASSSITKNTLAQNYIFSIWINAAAAGTLSFSGVTINPMSYAAGGWTYYELKIPATALASTFTLSFTSSQNISIDDILLYPDVAEALTTTYDATGHYKIAETNTNGVSAYYTNDALGRMQYRYDQDKNIVEKKIYMSPAEIAGGEPTPTCTPTTATVNTSATFTIPGVPCITGTTYSWVFDGGTPTSGLNLFTVSHTFTTVGTHTLTITATNPLLSTSTSTQTITVGYPTINASICMSGVYGWNNCPPYGSLGTVACGSNPDDNTHTYYTATVGGTTYGTISYQWQMSTTGNQAFSNISGATSSQYSVVRPHGGLYTTGVTNSVQCVITTSVGQSATSNSATFTVQTCP